MDDGIKRINALLKANEARDVQRLRADVWELKSPRWGARARRHRELRGQILATILALPVPIYLFYSEDPGEEFGSPWPLVAKNLWRVVPQSVTSERLEAFLYLGAWAIFAGATASPSDWIGKGRDYPKRMEDDLSGEDISLILAAYLDDDPWWIAFRTETESDP